MNSENVMSDLFDLYARDFFSPMMGEENAETYLPNVEAKETEEGYTVRAELPEILKEDILLSLEDNCLILKHKLKTFYRIIPLRADVDDNKIDAKFTDGFLTVTLMKKTDGTVRSKSIEIS